MSLLNQVALDHSLTLVQTIKGVNIQGPWQKLPGKNIYTLPLCLELIEAEPTPFIANETDWFLVVDFEEDEWGKTQLFPAAGERGISVTFPHQMFNGYAHRYVPSCKSGNLCTASGFDGLAANRNAIPAEPSTTIDRVYWHVCRGMEWLKSAANNTLCLPGSPFELPDFSFGKHAGSAWLAYHEDEESLKKWAATSIESGIVELANFPKDAIFTTLRFFDTKKKEVIHEPEWGYTVKQLTSVFHAFWIRLPEMPVVNNWQAPSTIKELQEVLAIHGKNLSDMLDPLWNKLSENHPCILLVGAPIPQKIGGALTYMHWQPMFVGHVPKGRRQKGWTALLRHHMKLEKHPISWIGRSENWHPEQLQSRGRLKPELCNAKILLIGGGAFGSNLAELLVRMGVNNLVLVDFERLEAGNLVRHTLSLNNLNQVKAKALADRLNLCSASANVTYIETKVPNASNKDLHRAIDEADIIIDATADDDVLKSLPVLKSAVTVISCSLSLQSEHLFLYANNGQDFSWADFDDWFLPFRLKQNELLQNMDLPRGVGCWHPLTPARLNRIQSLSGIAVELIEEIYNGQPTMPVKKAIEWPVYSI